MYILWVWISGWLNVSTIIILYRVFQNTEYFHHPKKSLFHFTFLSLHVIVSVYSYWLFSPALFILDNRDQQLLDCLQDRLSSILPDRKPTWKHGLSLWFLGLSNPICSSSCKAWEAMYPSRHCGVCLSDGAFTLENCALPVSSEFSSYWDPLGLFLFTFHYIS